MVNRRSLSGFTFVELIVVLGILTTIFAYAWINLGNLPNKANLDAALTLLISDMKSQQIKAMVGDTEGRSYADSYGIRFETNRYVLFNGATYNASNSANFAVNLASNLRLTNILFPNSRVVFASGSGEINGFVSGSDKVTIGSSVSSDQYTLTVNRYGTVVNVN